MVNSCRNSCGRDGRAPMPPQTNGMGGRMPLAMAYVPLQEWREIYPPDEALSIGTIFKELNLPFYGRRPCK